VGLPPDELLPLLEEEELVLVLVDEDELLVLVLVDEDELLLTAVDEVLVAALVLVDDALLDAVVDPPALAPPPPPPEDVGEPPDVHRPLQRSARQASRVLNVGSTMHSSAGVGWPRQPTQSASPAQACADPQQLASTHALHVASGSAMPQPGAAPPGPEVPPPP
jgi:hypothetical protein